MLSEERDKACRIGEQIARKRGYQLRGKAAIGREPREQCHVLVVVAPAHAAHTFCHVHIVLEIRQNDRGRFLHTLDVHTGSAIIEEQLDCETCDGYHTYELYSEESDEDLEGHQCEGGSFWDDGDGKGGFTPCTRTDTQWYESGFLLTGMAGWFCPSHAAEAYEEDLKAVKRARERAEKLKAEAARNTPGG